MKMIVAVDQDNAIGWSNGDLPWHSSVDLRRFKKLTSTRINKLDRMPAIVMGLNTHLSINRILPNRENFVLTSNPNKILHGATCISLSDLDYSNDAWIIGGAKLYNYVLEKKLIDEIYLTKVHLSSGADVRINCDLFNADGWYVFSSYYEPIVIPNEPSITFQLLIKK